MTTPEYQPDSVSQLLAALTKACNENDVLSRLEPHEIRKFVDVLSTEQFSENRKRAQKLLRANLDAITERLIKEDRLAT